MVLPSLGLSSTLLYTDSTNSHQPQLLAYSNRTYPPTSTSSVDLKETEDEKEKRKEERVHYDGYQVIRALPDSPDQLDTLQTVGE